MASNYWIKLYIEIIDDAKMGQMTDRLFRRTIQLFLLAGEVNQDGLLPSVSDMSWRLRIMAEELETDLADLASLGIIHKQDSAWVVAKFSDRQKPVSDAERMRRYRERKQKALYYGNDERYDSVTKRNVESESDIESEVETESEVEVDLEINNDGVYTELSAAFVNKTGIPELTGGPQKWYDSLIRMGKAGVSTQDVEKAVDILRDRDYSIVRLSSIENTAIGEMSKRTKAKGRDLTEDERSERYTGGEFADFIEH